MPEVSIIIPTLNEAATIERTLRACLALPGEKEVLVVDGGSDDATVELAARAVSVLRAERGRAAQMNAGAAAARGDVLLFLHSDTIPPPTALADIRAALAHPRTVGGAFRLAIDDPAPVFRLVEAGSNARARFRRVFFGDQGIFCRREAFRAAGGFPPLALMEDWEFSRRLKRLGRTVLLPSRVRTSSRRWRRHGVWRTILLMHWLKLRYLAGTPPEELRRLYRDAR